MPLRLFPDPILRRTSRPLADADFAERPVAPLTVDGHNSVHAAAPIVDAAGDRWYLRDLAVQMLKDVVLYRGHALAAVQVGVPVAMFVVQRGPKLPADCPEVVCNPVVVPGTETPLVTFHGESCLSLPGVTGTTRRMPSYTLRYQDERGDHHEYACTGLFAIVVQHEMDHLSGILFDARVDPWCREKVQKAINRLRPRK